jgi:RHS repeat-associated protein
MKVKKTYMYANGEILMQHNGNHTADKYFYLHDRLGSVREIIDTDGAVVRNYTYGPFGQTIEEGGTLTNPFMFTGQYYDSEIGQYYLRARQYDPQLMRFTAYDPIRGKFEEPMTLHKYLYCGNEPIDWTDPRGLKIELKCEGGM